MKKIIIFSYRIIKHTIKWFVYSSYRKTKKLIDCSRLRRYFQVFSIRVANLAFDNTFKIATTDQINFIKSSGIFGGNKSIDIHKIYQEWNHAGYLWNKGYYNEFCELSKSCLEKIYQSQKIDDSDQVAPMLSYGWGSAIGHMGSMGAFLTAQHLGIVPSLKRILPVYSNEQSNQVKIFFQDKVTQFKCKHSYSLLDHPNQWHISERLMMIKTVDDFISLYDLHERTYSTLNNKKKDYFIHLDQEYEIKAREKLVELGLPKKSWFVGFHLRENQDSLDPRCASLESFIPSLQKINACGGWIVRFGTGRMKPVNGVKNILDLNVDSNEYRYLHPYILAKAKFLLITNSGPAVMAWALGTPVLQTNTTSIARNILSASRGSLYLPKIWIYKGEKYSYARLVKSLEGYSETNLYEKEIAGYRLLENTADEILEATNEMLISSQSSLRAAKETEQLNEIRQNSNVVGYGEIASSFLIKHSDWFLK